MRARGAAALAALFALAGCDSGQLKEPSLPPPHIISGPLPVPSACAGRAQSPDHPGEPSLAVDPTNPRQLVATWQENRSPDDVGNVVAVSHDGGSTWNRAVLPSVLTCTGGPYTHATDPWVSIGQDGIVYVCALATRSRSSAGTTRDIVVSISRDHGATWEAPAVLQSLTAPPALPDKDAILADPRRPGVAYAIWVEYPVAESAPSSVDQVVFARTTDGGHTWSKPVSIYNGNDEAQEHQLLMTAGGVLLDVFVEGSSLPGTPHPPPLPVKIRVMRSTTPGHTWRWPAMRPSACSGSMFGISPLAARGSTPTSGSVPRAIAAPVGRSATRPAHSTCVPLPAEVSGRSSATTWDWWGYLPASPRCSSRPSRKAGMVRRT